MYPAADLSEEVGRGGEAEERVEVGVDGGPLFGEWEGVFGAHGGGLEREFEGQTVDEVLKMKR